MERAKYPDDLTDREWEELEPLRISSQGKGGKPPKYPRREMPHSIFYVLRTGCSWRHLPHDFPPWHVVYVQFSRWKKKEVMEQLHKRVREKLRKALKWKVKATAGIADSQSVKTTEKGGLRVLMGEKGQGRKRHLLVDTEGLVIKNFVTAANLEDRQGLFGILDEWKNRGKKLKIIWVDGGYAGEHARWYAEQYGIKLEVVKGSDTHFKVLPRRWVVERTFAWLNKFRRMSKDYEFMLETSESMIYVCMLRNMIRRIASL